MGTMSWRQGEDIMGLGIEFSIKWCGTVKCLVFGVCGVQGMVCRGVVWYDSAGFV